MQKDSFLDDENPLRSKLEVGSVSRGGVFGWYYPFMLRENESVSIASALLRSEQKRTHSPFIILLPYCKIACVRTNCTFWPTSERTAKISWYHPRGVSREGGSVKRLYWVDRAGLKKSFASNS